MSENNKQRPPPSSLNFDSYIHSACRINGINSLQSALEQDPSCINQRGLKLNWSPVFRCVVSGSTVALKVLLENGADPNLPNDSGETPLHQAVENKDYLISKILLKHKADPNRQEEYGETPLHYAVTNGDSDTTELLLKFRANPNICETRFKRTPLHIATMKKNREIVKILMVHGANPHEADVFGKTACNDKENSKCMFNATEISAIGKPEKTISFSHSNIEKHDKSISFSINDSQPKNIDIQHGKLYYWLQRLSLQQYYNLLVLNQHDNLDELAHKMRTPTPVTTQELENIGISKIADRYKILINLDIEAGIAAPIAVRNLVFDDPAWCVDCQARAVGSLLTLESWLELGGIPEATPHFEAAGYSLEMVMFQAQSDYRFTNAMLMSELGIKNKDLRVRFLRYLRETLSQPNFSVSSSSCTKCLLM